LEKKHKRQIVGFSNQETSDLFVTVAREILLFLDVFQYIPWLQSLTVN